MLAYAGAGAGGAAGSRGGPCAVAMQSHAPAFPRRPLARPLIMRAKATFPVRVRRIAHVDASALSRLWHRSLTKRTGGNPTLGLTLRSRRMWVPASTLIVAATLRMEDSRRGCQEQGDSAMIPPLVALRRGGGDAAPRRHCFASSRKGGVRRVSAVRGRPVCGVGEARVGETFVRNRVPTKDEAQDKHRSTGPKETGNDDRTVAVRVHWHARPRTAG